MGIIIRLQETRFGLVPLGEGTDWEMKLAQCLFKG